MRFSLSFLQEKVSPWEILVRAVAVVEQDAVWLVESEAFVVAVKAEVGLP